MIRYIRVWWLLYRRSTIDPTTNSRAWPGWTAGFWRTYLRQQVTRDRAGLPLLDDAPQEPPSTPYIVPEYIAPDSWMLSTAAACGHPGDAGHPSAGDMYVPSVQHPRWTGPKHSLPDQDEPDGPVEHVGADKNWSLVLAEFNATPQPDDEGLYYKSRHSHRDGVFDAIVADLKFASDRFDTTAADEQQRRRSMLETVNRHWAATDDTAYLDVRELEELLAEPVNA